ncbi:hypothetical protein CWB76_14625 [Pseudoalteromonas sp. S1609]|nr:hypothetical protein CWB76_14625 [Pseudoalteromonas sp. S1609]
MVLKTKKSLLVNTQTVSQMAMRVINVNHVNHVNHVNYVITPIVYTIPLQLLSHYKAEMKVQILTNHAIWQSRPKNFKINRLQV